MSFFSDNIDLLARMLDVGTKRQQTIASNIAHINTPNYRAKKVDFEKKFELALREGGSKEALGVEMDVIEQEDAKAKADGNTVHLESELPQLQKNQMLQGLYSTLLRHKIRGLRNAIQNTR